MSAPAPIRRVLLALDAMVHDAEAFEAAGTLAARFGAEIEALFVEDIDLARLAALPFAREFGLSSATRRPLQHGDVERAWRSEALRARTALSQAAARHRVRWSFRVLRGRTGTALVQLAAHSDLITFTLAGAGVATVSWMAMVENMLRDAPCPLLVRPAGVALRAPFVVLFDGSESSGRALRLAVQLARDDGGGEVVALLAVADPARRAPLRAQAEAIAGSVGVPIATRTLARLEPAAVAAAIRALQPGALILAADSPWAGAATLRQLPAAIGCSSLLVR